jgi:tRNA modification GTPase
MDLAQAEAVRDLIRSQTAHQARVARDQLDGKLSRALRSVKESLVRVVSHLETGLEFVEDPVEPDSRDKLLRDLRRIAGRIGELEESFRVGRVLRDGFVATIVGRPNAGKSSIFNALCRNERAIVSSVAGTTRDAIDQTVDLEGIPMQLVDTAGIRKARNPVERLGVRKSLDYVGASDLTLFVVDRSRDFSTEDARIWTELKDTLYLLVVNKIDLEAVVRIPSELESGARSRSDVSALTGQGLDTLRGAIREAVAPDSDWERERVVITDVRHKECLQRARQRLGAGMDAYRDGLSEEFPLYHLRGALTELDGVTGETTVEDLLGRIFSSFCIGK